MKSALQIKTDLIRACRKQLDAEWDRHFDLPGHLLERSERELQALEVVYDVLKAINTPRFWIERASVPADRLLRLDRNHLRLEAAGETAGAL